LKLTDRPFLNCNTRRTKIWSSWTKSKKKSGMKIMYHTTCLHNKNVKF